jgi:hypothetical protein
MRATLSVYPTLGLLKSYFCPALLGLSSTLVRRLATINGRQKVSADGSDAGSLVLLQVIISPGKGI